MNLQVCQFNILNFRISNSLHIIIERLPERNTLPPRDNRRPIERGREFERRPFPTTSSNNYNRPNERNIPPQLTIRGRSKSPIRRLNSRDRRPTGPPLQRRSRSPLNRRPNNNNSNNNQQSLRPRSRSPPRRDSRRPTSPPRNRRSISNDRGRNRSISYDRRRRRSNSSSSSSSYSSRSRSSSGSSRSSN